MPPGGPAANRLTAFDPLCGNEACRGEGAPQAYVGLADLSLYVRVLDLSLAGSRPALTLERHYNQNDTAVGPFGPHWSFNLGESLTVDADSSVLLRRGSGRQDRFAIGAGSTTYFAATPTNDTLTRDASGRWTLRSSDGTSRTFYADGRLITWSDGGLVRFTLEYNSAGRLATARSHGRTFTFAWDGSHIASVSDSAGRTVSYTYSSDGFLTGQTNADGQAVGYEYDGSGLLKSITWSGGTTSIGYNTDDTYVSVSSATTPDGAIRSYDNPRSPREIRVTDGAGNSILYTSNTLGLLESVADAYGLIRFTYDSGGRRTQVTNAAGEVTRFEYDASGNPSAVVDGAGNRWTAEYSGGRLSRVVDPNGGGWSFGYDDSGTINAVTSPGGNTASADRNPAGTVASFTSLGQTGSYQYDGDGLVKQYTDSVGNVYTFQYDGAGRVSSRTDAAGNSLKPEYGAGLKPVAMTAAGGRAPLDGSGITRDAQGRITASTDAGGNQARYAWNPAGRLARITLPGDRAISYDYDRAGRLSKVSDWAGNFAVYRYDASGYPTSLNVSGGPVTVYQYDAARNLKAVVSTGPDGSPVAGYRYTLDGLANRTGIIALEPVASLRLAPAGFGYDAANRPVSRGDGTAYRYDAQGNLTAVEGGPSLGFSWDAFGRLQAVTGDTAASYTYDASGLRAQRTVNGTVRRFLYDLSGAYPRLLMESDGGGNPVAYYVWGAAPLWKVTPDGKPYFYHFDGEGNVTALTTPAAGVVNRYRYDALGRLASADEGVDNPLRARGAAGVIDDGNGILYGNGAYLYPELRLALRGSIEIGPPPPDLTPPLPGAGLCLLRGAAECAPGARGVLQ